LRNRGTRRKRVVHAASACGTLATESFQLERFNKIGSQNGKSVGRFREVLDYGSSLPLFHRSTGSVKRQRAAAVQDAGAQFDGPSIFGGCGIFETALNQKATAAALRRADDSVPFSAPLQLHRSGLTKFMSLDRRRAGL
jgi:hypothetical protein